MCTPGVQVLSRPGIHATEVLAQVGEGKYVGTFCVILDVLAENWRTDVEYSVGFQSSEAEQFEVAKLCPKCETTAKMLEDIDVT